MEFLAYAAAAAFRFGACELSVLVLVLVEALCSGSAEDEVRGGKAGWVLDLALVALVALAITSGGAAFQRLLFPAGMVKSSPSSTTTWSPSTGTSPTDGPHAWVGPMAGAAEAAEDSVSPPPFISTPPPPAPATGRPGLGARMNTLWACAAGTR